MANLLRIDASARCARSLTRALSDAFVASYTRRAPQAKVVVRDVGRSPPPIVTEDWIAAAFARARTPAQEALLETSNRLIEEVRMADVIIVGTPMYNYGMPAALKAWFDQVIRIGQTFTFDLERGDRPIEPILSGKTLVLLTSVGEFGFEPGGVNEAAGHLVPHLETLARYLGAEGRVHHVGVEYQEFGDDRHAASKLAAFEAIPALVQQLTSVRAAA